MQTQREMSRQSAVSGRRPTGVARWATRVGTNSCSHIWADFNSRHVLDSDRVIGRVSLSLCAFVLVVVEIRSAEASDAILSAVITTTATTNLIAATNISLARARRGPGFISNSSRRWRAERLGGGRRGSHTLGARFRTARMAPPSEQSRPDQSIALGSEQVYLASGTPAWLNLMLLENRAPRNDRDLSLIHDCQDTSHAPGGRLQRNGSGAGLSAVWLLSAPL